MCIVYSLWNSFVKWFTQPPFFSFRWLGFRQLFIKLEGTNQSSLKVCDIKNESINLPICHEGVLVSRNCTCTLCKTGQKQNKLEKQDLKQEKKNSSWQRTAYWMYKDRRIVPLHDNSPVPVVAWVRFSDPHNIKVTWRLCETLLSVHFPATGFLFFFFFSGSLVLYTGYLNKPSNFKFEWETLDNELPMEVLMLKSKLFFILILFCSTEGGEVQKKVSQYRPSAGRRDEADPHLMVQSKHPKVYFH